jgi:hypothetical protein
MIPLPEDQPPQPRDIKLPPFWTTRPRAYVLSALPAEMVSQVIDLVDTLPSENHANGPATKRSIT